VRSAAPDQPAPGAYQNDFVAGTWAAWAAGRPELAGPAARLMAALAAGEALRQAEAARRGLELPETLALSLTSACERRCRFCRVGDQVRGPLRELPPDLLSRALAEAEALGARRVALIGGDPLLHPAAAELVAAHPDLFFTVFTNGSRLDEALIARLGALANCALVVNASAWPAEPDQALSRRLAEVLARLDAGRCFFGFSATVHRENLEAYARPELLEALYARGARFGILFDYLADFGVQDDPLSVPAARREELVASVRALAARLARPLLLAPEDEAVMGGCAAAGRQVLHLGPSGEITPCPLVPFSPFRLGQVSLLEALESGYFRELRERSRAWERLDGACAYRAAHAELAEICARHRAARAS